MVQKWRQCYTNGLEPSHVRLYKLRLGFLSFGHYHYRKPFVFQFPLTNQIFDDNSMSQRETDFLSFHLSRPYDFLEIYELDLRWILIGWSPKLDRQVLNSCAFFLLDSRTFFWQFITKTRVSEIWISKNHERHVVQVENGLNTRRELMNIVISGPLPVKLPIKIAPKNFYCTKRLALKFEGESLRTVFW